MGITYTNSVSKANRVGSADAIKGVAIILMVYGHVAQGAMHRQLWDNVPSWQNAVSFANAFIYSFHMAAFFFVAGLFIVRSVNRRGNAGFFFEKLQTILYPYLLWAVFFWLLLPVTGRFMSHRPNVSWRDLMVGIASGNMSWFLVTLFVCQMFALIVVRLPHWLQMSIALLAYFTVPSSGVNIFFSPIQYFPFVVAGMWFSEDRLPMLHRLGRAAAWGGFAVLLAAQLMLIHFLGPVSARDRFPIGIVGIVMLLFLSEAIRGTFADVCLQWFGNASLAIFLLAPFFQGAAREFVTRVLHVMHPVPYLGLITVAAATIPALVWKWKERLHISWLFRWPASRKRSVAAPAVAGR